MPQHKCRNKTGKKPVALIICRRSGVTKLYFVAGLKVVVKD